MKKIMYILLLLLWVASLLFALPERKDEAKILQNLTGITESSIVSILKPLSSILLEVDEYWISVVFASEPEGWVCFSNKRFFLLDANGEIISNRDAPNLLKYRKPKVSIFDAMALVSLQTRKNTLAVYLCTDIEEEYWKVLAEEELFFVDAKSPMIFRKESILEYLKKN